MTDKKIDRAASGARNRNNITALDSGFSLLTYELFNPSLFAIHRTPMSRRAKDLMHKPAVNRLLAAESLVLARGLAGQAGDHGLYLGMSNRVAKDLPRMACWTRLRLADGMLHGDVKASVAEPLPFADESFRVVVLSHVLEWTPHAADLLDEALRVLRPEGVLAVTGFEPFSAWMPWLLCRRSPRPMLIPRAWLRQRLAPHCVQMLHGQRCGAAWPMRRGGMAPAWLGGGFVLVARKRRAAVMRLKPRACRQSVGRREWVPGTHRECA